MAGCRAASGCLAAGSGPRPSAILHDLAVTSAQVRVLAGAPYTASATAPAGVTLTSVSWDFGNGNSSVVSYGSAGSTTYTDPGLYFLYASAVDSNSVTHDNGADLLPLEVLPSHAQDLLGDLPDLLGNVQANATSTSGATAAIAPGGWVRVAVTVASPARNAATVTGTPSFSLTTPGATYGTLSNLSVDATGASTAVATFGASTPAGLYGLEYTVPESTLSNGTTVVDPAHYLFTVAVGLAGPAVPTPSPPSPGTLTVYQPGFPTTFDPSIDYETSGQIALGSIYETLIAYNGTASGPLPSDFVPELATCVPGSAACTGLYGTDLVSSDGHNYTFAVSSAARFYDPTTGNSWGVYPTDVVFSIARTLAFSTVPCYGCNNGWILAQSLLPAGNPSWDGNLHAPSNNTPSAIFSSMTVNGTDCPAAALSGAHGCVTFHANGSGLLWPEFLSLIGQPDGGAIVPCGWFSALGQGAGIPYWTEGNVSGSGDHPCPVVGTSGYGVNPATVDPTAWDTFEINGGSGLNPPTLTYVAAGSGPYYLSSVTPQAEYQLAANPAYHANPDCAGPGCLPAAGAYIGNVTVLVELGSTGPGLQAIASGTADLAVVASNSTGSLLPLISAGVAVPRSDPVLQSQQIALAPTYNSYSAYLDTGWNFTAPTTLLSDLNLRQFLIHSFSYSQAQTHAFTQQGIQFRFPSGAPISTFTGTYAPTNVSWPSGNADGSVADVGSAGYWWARANSDAPVSSSCSTVSPCTLPVAYAIGDNATLATLNEWNGTVRNLSGGAIAPVIFGLPFITLIIDLLYQGGGSPFALYPASWLADYPDPSDQVSPYYAPLSFWAYSSQLSTSLEQAAYEAGTCGTSLTQYSSLTTPIPVDCQGTAYSALASALPGAAVLTNGPARALVYNEIEQVANSLGLYAPMGQSNIVTAMAPWIDPTSVVVNPALAGFPFYDVRYRAIPSTPLAVRGPFASVNPVTVGESTTLQAYGSGGSGGYSYAWSGLPTSCASVNAPQLNCTPTIAANYTVSVRVSDGVGSHVTGQLTLVVVSAPVVLVQTFSVAPNPVDAGTNVTLQLVGSGGTAPIQVSITAFGTCPTSFTWTTTRSTSAPCAAPATPGAYTLTATLDDALGMTAGAQLQVTVNATPSVSYFGPSVATDVGVPFALEARWNGGTGPYATTFTGLPAGCVAANLSTVNCNVPVAGSYSPNVTVTDAFGVSATLGTQVAIFAAPSVTGFTSAPTEFPLGQSTVLTVTLTGGMAPMTYAYSSLPPGCTTANSARLTCTPNASGSYVVSVTVTDGAGLRAHANVSLTVDATSSSGGGASADWLSTYGLDLVLGAIVVVAAIVVAVALLRRRRSEGPPPEAPE